MIEGDAGCLCTQSVTSRRAVQCDTRWRACACMVLALVFLSTIEAAAQELKIGGTGTALGGMRLLGDEFTRRNPDLHLKILPSLGSAGGIQALIAGAIDIAVSSRPLTENERDRGATEIEYARTPLVFAVSVNSTVTALSTGELADIYLGKSVTWPDGGAIRLVLRPKFDSDTDILTSISPAMRRGLAVAHARPGVRFAATDQDAADDLERIPGAVGSISLAVIAAEKRPLRALQLDGTTPTPMNAASGAYPFAKGQYLVTLAKRSTAVDRFVAFVQSAPARQILTSHGYWIP